MIFGHLTLVIVQYTVTDRQIWHRENEWGVQRVRGGYCLRNCLRLHDRTLTLGRKNRDKDSVRRGKNSRVQRSYFSPYIRV